MAENSGRGNIIDAIDGPKGGDETPPPVTSDVKGAITQGAGTASAGMHASGQEADMQPDPTLKVKHAKPEKKGF